MSRRIDIELTSARPDDTWTWRAAGAREPKGVMPSSLVPGGAAVGDVLRVDADFDVDGITIVAVLPPKGTRKEPERLVVLGSGEKFEPVVSTLAPRSDRGDRGDRGDRRPRRDGPDRDRGPRGDRPDRPRGDRPDGGRGGPRPAGDRGSRPPGGPTADRGERPARTERPARPPRPELPSKPKPKRLRAGRTHVNAVLSELPAEHRPIAEKVLRGGLQSVRQAIDEQNKALEAEGQPAIKAAPLVDLASDLLPRLRMAEWHDRAEAALAGVDEIDLRDLRSVVAAASDGARDDVTRDLAGQLREGLNRRQDRDYSEWLAEIGTELSEGRSIRALRLSSRPPKAGVPFPADLASRLATAVSSTLTAEAPNERWLAAIDALAVSPIRSSVKPAGVPATPTDELKAAVTRASGSIPDLARAFGIEPATTPARPPRGPRRPPKPPSSRQAPVTDAPAPEATAPTAETVPEAATELPAENAPETAAETPAPEVPAETVPEAATDTAPEATPTAESP
ncbi:MAG: hypothetical protein JWL70_2448, partial [Acidimicrobiia bacterium]|nr:hypothetical protein [Acidimicrobiia bacterium]